MGNRKWYRWLCLFLAVCLLAGAALCANAQFFAGDMDGDGKITAFDAQMVGEGKTGSRVLTAIQQAIADNASVRDLLNYVFGNRNIDAGDTNGDGVLEIYTAAGLQQLHETPDGHYILMNDLDLEGADWTPVAGFSGSFSGNGKTISNFTILTAKGYNQGFFGDTAKDSSISDLHLRNVTLTAAENTRYIGFFAGTHRGALTNCTVTGTLNDSREVYSENVYIGVMAGLLASSSNGSITGGTTLSIADENGQYTTSGLCAEVKLNIANDQLNIISGSASKIGIAGYAPGGYTVTGKFADTTYSSDLLSETIQARQDKAVDYMNAMGSVKWTPSEELVYTANNGTNQTFSVGTVYSGLPYNTHNGSLERFLSVMGEPDASGVYTTQTGLESGGWIASAITTKYIRMGTKTDSSTGEVRGIVYKDLAAPETAITFSTDGNTLCYVTDDATYYLGATASNANLHMTGTSVSSLPAHLYTISSSGKATLVTSPKTGTAYKLGVKNADGAIVYFNGESVTVGGVGCLQTTAEPGEAVDMYLATIDGGYQLYFETDGAWTEDGFHLIMGNDCSGAVNWAWLQISNTLVADVPSHANPYMGGVNVVTTNYMIPNDSNRPKYGTYPVGTWEPSVVVGTLTDGSEKRESTVYDLSVAAYSCTDQVYTPAILQENGMDTILEAYAQSHKADALVCYVDRWSNGNPRPGGHVRLITADPVVIRNTDGTIDSKASYLLMSEQGVGFTAGSTSTWNVNKKIPFYTLAGSTTEDAVTLSTKVYVPITIRALQEDYAKPTFVTEVSSAPINSPAEGRIYSYHHINSVTVSVMNGSGTILYQHEGFTGINNTDYRGMQNNVLLSDLHADAFYAAAPSVLRAGRTYYFHVDVTLSTGEVVRLVDNRTFTYTPQ